MPVWIVGDARGANLPNYDTGGEGLRTVASQPLEAANVCAALSLSLSATLAKSEKSGGEGEGQGGGGTGPGRSGRGVATPRFAFISLYNIHFFYRLNSERTTPVSAFADCPVVRDHLI